MQLSTVEFKNYRAFEHFQINLHPEFTLLVGANGSGKTSVLDGIAVVLGAWLLEFPGGIAPPIKRDDVRRVPHANGGVATLEAATPTWVRALGRVEGQPLTWGRSLRTLDDRTTTEEATSIAIVAAGAHKGVVAGRPVDLPLVAYYGTGRLWLQKRLPEERRPQLDSRIQGYRSCLEPASDLRWLETWMRWREEARLQEIAMAFAEGRDASGVTAPELQAIEAAACECVDGARAFRYDVAFKELRFTLSDGRQLPFHMLSDGFRNLVAMAADIAWRAVVLNPHRAASAPRLVQGVVLIDEINLHLHPRWQRTVIGSLRKVFPGIQFVATTHSPQVVGSARREWVRLLDVSGRVSPVGFVEGRDSNGILEDVFGVPDRPEATRGALTQLFEAIDVRASALARSQLAALEGHLGPDDPDRVRARWLLDQEDPAS